MQVKLAKERAVQKILAKPDQQQLDAAIPVAKSVRQLRSKCTIDILETIEEKQVKRSKSGTRSAPLGLDRSRERGNINQSDQLKLQKQASGANLRSGKSEHSTSPVPKTGKRTLTVSSAKGAHPNSFLAAQSRAKQDLVGLVEVSRTEKSSPGRVQQAKVNKQSSPVLSTADPYDYSRFNKLLNEDFSNEEDSATQSGKEKSSSIGRIHNTTDVKTRVSAQNVDDKETEDPVSQSEREYADIQSSITRLKLFEANSETTTKGGAAADISSFTKKATKLGSHFNNADDIMSRYRTLANEFD